MIGAYSISCDLDDPDYSSVSAVAESNAIFDGMKP
jgi:hypothetical protein